MYNNYYETFIKNIKNYFYFEIKDEEIQMLRNAAHKMEEKQNFDMTFKLDRKNITERFMVGLLGEYAVNRALKHFGLIDEVPDYTNIFVGFSKNYDVPDFIDNSFALGCKTCVYGNNIMFRKNNDYPEVVCVYHKETSRLYICGIATKEIRNRYSSIDLVTNPDILKKYDTPAGKVGFNRFDVLLPFTKENILKTKVDMKLNIHNYNDNELENSLIRNCVYGETRKNTVFFRKYNKDFRTGVFDFYDVEVSDELTTEDMAKLRTILKDDTTIVGYGIENIMRKIQCKYVGEPITMQIYDLCNTLNTVCNNIRKMPVISDDMRVFLNVYETVCHRMKAEEAMHSLAMFTRNYPRVNDGITGNFYIVLSQLNNATQKVQVA